jgi:adenylate cyclase
LEGDAVSFQIPANETERLIALRQLDIMHTPPEIPYQEITELAAHISGCPVAYISFVDDERRWLKARYGLGPELIEVPRAAAICTTTICGTEVLIVPDMKRDPRFANSPTARANPPCRFIAACR